MSRIAWIDASVGVAGDMLLAALLDAGASEPRVRAGLASLGLSGWSLRVTEVTRGAFRAKHVRVEVLGQVEAGGPDDAQGHDHDHGHTHAAPHAHGTWREIRARITAAPLPSRAKVRALVAYGRLAEAEARLHGLPLDQVVLHEVGATDAIVDIVGVCLALEDLGVERIVATALPLGGGFVRAAHGVIPLPAPATLDVAKGWPVVPARWPGEWVTPTGAALVTALAEAGPLPAMTPFATGYGAGTKDPPEVANLVRVVIGAAAEATEPHGDAIEIACNLDDVTGQQAADAVDAALAAGALDAWTTAIGMKKGRPGLQLSVLARPVDAERLADLLLRITPTLGVRMRGHTRRTLDRWFATVDTPYGPIRIKIGGRDGVAWQGWPEHDDVRAAAASAGVPAAEVHRAALAAWRP